MDRTVGALVIADGGIPGLLACAAAADGRLGRSDNRSGGVAVWVPPMGLGTDPRRVAAARVQAGLYGFMTDLDVEGPGQTGRPSQSDDEVLTRAVLDAAFLARELGASTVIYPANAGPGGVDGPDLERVAAAVDRALLVSRLVSLGSSLPVEVRAPYADITDAGLADLVLDMDLPIWTCWWALPGPDPAAVAEREYWTGLLMAAGWSGDWPGPAEPAQIVSNPARDRSAAHPQKGLR